jgi:carboxymethylenebutenolidase
MESSNQKSDMTKDITITTRDGHVMDGYIAEPAQAPRGVVVIAQEMYGVNRYLRGVADHFAAHGYLAVAPALHDRIEKGIVLDYTKEGHDRAEEVFRGADWDLSLRDLEDASRWATSTVGLAANRVAMVGFCYGGTLAWMAACRVPLACAVSYYGGDIDRYGGETPRCPILLHMGEDDRSFAPDKRQRFFKAQPDAPFVWYPKTGHGFDNQFRYPQYGEAAKLARGRTLAFLAEHLG